MKITKVQLKQIIKEELDAVLSETNERPRNPMERAYAKRETEIDLRKVFDAVVGGIDMDDRPDFANAYIESAEYEHSPGKFRKLTQSELDYLNSKESNWVYQQVLGQVY